MLEIFYQAGCSRIAAGKPSAAAEMLPVVNEQGIVTGQASRNDCHKRHLMHPVVHLHIIDRYSRIYLQHRSEKKDFLPSCWDTAVGGHISYGEYALEALFREAREELGLEDFNPVEICSYVFESDHDLELVLVYAAAGNFTPVPDGEEVSEGKYWTDEELEKAMGKGLLTPQFESEYRRIKEKLLALL